jgi:hypothetical protein
MNLETLWTILGAIGVSIMGLWVWAIQRHIATTTQNTIQLAILTERTNELSKNLEGLTNLFHQVQVIKKDVDFAHEKIRELKRTHLEAT